MKELSGGCEHGENVHSLAERQNITVADGNELLLDSDGKGFATDLKMAV